MRFFLGFCLSSLLLGGCGGSGDSGGATGAALPNAPAIASLSPSSASVGGNAFTLTVIGSNFDSGSVVAWNGVALPTSFASATQLTTQVPASDLTASGTVQVTVMNSGANGGTSSAASFSIGSIQSGTPQLAQWNSAQTLNNDTEVNSTVQFKSLTKAGDTIWVAATVSDYGGIHTLSVTDTQGNVYTQLDQENDGQPGSQTVAHFYAANIIGDSTTADTITVNWGFDNYKGILIAEISGTTTAPLAGHGGNIQDALGGGTANVTSGSINVSSAQTPALLLALSMNTSGGSSDTGGSGATGPAAGSGMTSVANVWDWGVNLATFASEPVTTAESITAAFNAPDVDSYVTVAAVFH